MILGWRLVPPSSKRTAHWTWPPPLMVTGPRDGLGGKLSWKGYSLASAQQHGGQDMAQRCKAVPVLGDFVGINPQTQGSWACHPTLEAAKEPAAPTSCHSGRHLFGGASLMQRGLENLKKRRRRKCTMKDLAPES